MLCPPPSTTLFPYTTLFRSHHELSFPRCENRKPGSQSRCTRSHWTDRNSTRLNSSHVAISYAVFCLKNKKKKTYIVDLWVVPLRFDICGVRNRYRRLLL